MKSIYIGREGGKPLLLADDMILYIENPKVSTPKLLELINEFSNAAGYKINAISLLCFCTLTRKYQKENVKK